VRKEGGQAQGSGDGSPPVESRGKAPVKGLGDVSSPRSWRFFVTECLNFDVIEENIQPKIPS